MDMITPPASMATIVSQAGQHVSPPQSEILAHGLLDTGFSCVLQMPTGSGKTWLAERAIAKVLSDGGRAIYLTPLRALATELMARWQHQFGAARVGVFTGEYGSVGARPYPVPYQQARLLVMTPERLDACTRNWRAHWSWIPEVDLLVVDEFHLLGERHRGARLEGTILRFRRLNPFTRIVALSATLGNRHELADWLDGLEYGSSWRPVPLRWRTERYQKASEKPDLLVREVSATIAMGGKSLVFVQSRRRAEALSRLLRSAGLRAEHHHAGLGASERRRVEDAFRSAGVESGLDVVVATATLEMGLNLPVRQVVLYDLQAFDGVDFRPLSVASVWQRAGRAGRPGLDPAGEVVLLTPHWDHQVDRYAEGAFEPIYSGLTTPGALAEQIVAEVASGLARTPAQLEAVFRLSLAAHQHASLPVQAILAEMLSAGMLRGLTPETAPETSAMSEPPEISERRSRALVSLRATPLGRIAVRHLLAPATVLLFHRILDPAVSLSFLDLLLVAASALDCEPVLPADFEELDGLAEELAGERSFLLQRSRVALAHLLGIDGKRLLASLKMALVARAWTRMGDAIKVAERYGSYPFEVERLRESLDRLLLVMSAVLSTREHHERVGEEQAGPPTPPVEYGAVVPLQERLQALQRMVAVGLDEEAVTLTLVKGIGAQWARRLRAEGITDIQALALAVPTELAHMCGLSSQRAAQWIQDARARVRARPAYAYRETGDTVELAPPGWPAGIDPYRLRRALELRVAGADGGTHRVTGGLEPHTVRITFGGHTCDCADAERGAVCKHVLAVRLYRGDQSLSKLARQLDAGAPDAKLNLFDLWFASPRTDQRRVAP